MNFAEVAPVLQAIGMDEAQRRSLDRSGMAAELGLTTGELSFRLNQLEDHGLIAW